jgi:hypothetical protein
MLRYDPKGKLSGRGAYVCARVACIALARKQKKLERSLKVSSVPEEVFAELNARAALNPDAKLLSTNSSMDLPSDLPTDLPSDSLSNSSTDLPSDLLIKPVAVGDTSGHRDLNRGAKTDVAINENGQEAAHAPQESEAENG